jgi:peptidoglycan/LPS O-acetylase OafA/YrhL
VGEVAKPRVRVDAIHGFRGFAVLLVVLSHLSVPRFENGFIGVDIFFVISGFLITHLLILEYTNNRRASKRAGWISFVAFYARRARRILPTAFFVLILVLLAASVLKSQINLVPNISQDASWAAFFVSNLHYMNQSTEYFGNDIQQSPFLHYWSLSVEEQFYLLWPVLFLTLTTIQGFKVYGVIFNWRNRLKLGMIVVLILSFSIYILHLIEGSPSSYYSSLGRFWEFALGAIFAVSAKNLLPVRIDMIHLIFTVISLFGFFLLDSQVFRYIIVFPLLLTASLLHQFVNGDIDSTFSRFFSKKPLLFLGTISFSLYLVHWPMIVFARGLGIQVFGVNLIWFVPLMLGVSWLVFREIESRFMKLKIPTVSKRGAARRQRYFPLNLDALRYSSFAIFVLIVALNLQVGVAKPVLLEVFKPKVVEPWTLPQNLAATGDSLTSAVELNPPSSNSLDILWKSKIQDGLKLVKLPEGMSAKLSNLTTERTAEWSKCLNLVVNKPECNYGNPGALKKIYIVGDSYAFGMTQMIARTFDAEAYYIVGRHKAECTVPDVNLAGGFDSSCKAHREAVKREIAKEKPYLVIAVSVNSVEREEERDQLFSAMLKEFDFFTANAANVLVIGETPFMADPRICIKSDKDFVDCKGSANARGQSRLLTQRAANLSGASYLDVTPWLCLSSSCPVIIDGAFTTWDGGHITSELSAKLSPLFRSFILSLGLSVK